MNLPSDDEHERHQWWDEFIDKQGDLIEPYSEWAHESALYGKDLNEMMRLEAQEIEMLESMWRIPWHS